MLRIITGCMFSGKTTKLLELIERYRRQDMSCIVVKYADDTRYSQKQLSTHEKQIGGHLTVDALSATHLIDIVPELEKHQVVALDEAQFYEDLVEVVLRLLKADKIVVVAALDSTWAQQPFRGETIQRLIPYAEKISKLTAICSTCKAANAVASIRITDSTEEKVIGGPDKYQASCLRCLFDKT